MADDEEPTMTLAEIQKMVKKGNALAFEYCPNSEHLRALFLLGYISGVIGVKISIEKAPEPNP